MPRERTPASGPPLVFASDKASPADPLGRAPAANLLAELALHAGAQTPFTIGLLGPAGAGKSAFLDKVLATAERLGLASGEAGLASAFVTDVAIVRVDAAAAGAGDPGAYLAAAVFDRLTHTHPDLANDIRHAGADPQEAARAADDALAETRRRLDAERQVLEDLTARDAQLPDTVLNTPGSLVDLYARSKRAGLDRIFRQFGFSAADPVATYKALVREAADGDGAASRVKLAARSITAYGGQMRLLVGAVLLAVLAWGCAVLADNQDAWLGGLRGMGDKAASMADWLGAHGGWVGTLQTVALLGAVALLLLNVMRAARFVVPIMRGADLLGQDLEGRRRELAGLVAHQTRRVDGLGGAAEAAARGAAEAERRAARRGGGRAVAVSSRPGGLPAVAGGAAGLLAAVSEAVAGSGAAAWGAAGQDAPVAPAPRRIIVAIDHLDLVPDALAARTLASAAHLLGPGFVTVAAVDLPHLLSGFGDADPARAAAGVARVIQVPFRVAGGDDEAGHARRAYAAALLGGEAPPGPATDPDPRRSLLDEPWRPREAETVASLAAHVGETPRAVKRFVNLYRVARADPRLRDAAPACFPALALALVLDQHGCPGDVDALVRVARGEAPGGDAAAIEEIWTTAREASGVSPDPAALLVARDVAATYAGRP